MRYFKKDNRDDDIESLGRANDEKSRLTNHDGVQLINMNRNKQSDDSHRYAIPNLFTAPALSGRLSASLDTQSL